MFVRTDADFDARYPESRMARIRITGTDGRVHERVVDDGYGSPAQPMDDAALAQKFEGLVAPITGLRTRAELRRGVRRSLAPQRRTPRRYCAYSLG